MTKRPADFLRACKKAKRNPDEIKSPEAYMRAWIRTGEQLRRGKK